MKKLVLVLCVMLLSNSVFAALPIEEKAANFVFSRSMALQLDDGSGVLNLRKMSDENVKQVIADLKRANNHLGKLSSIYISEEGIVIGLARVEGSEAAPILFMFQPNSRQPSIFHIKEIMNNKIFLDNGFAQAIGQ